MTSHLEVEIKLPVKDPEDMVRRLQAAGATVAAPRVLEDNHVLDFTDGRLRQDQVMLRLRLVDGNGLVTVKKKIAGDQGDYKIRQEQETVVEDGPGLLATLHAAGFVTAYRYEKYRRAFRAGNLFITLDELPLGNFLELEGEPADIDRFAGLLGFNRTDYINDSYRALHLRLWAEAGREGEPTELVFPGKAGL